MLESYMVWGDAALARARAWVRTRVSSLTGSEAGGVAAEYALLITLIAIAIIAGATALGVAINNRLNNTATSINGAGGGS